MAKQVVNTVRISTSASKLRTVNSNINTAFNRLNNSAKQKLVNNWNGRAGESAQTIMYKLFSNNDARSAVLQNYINILEQQIDPGYENTETTNEKLADKFK